MVAIFWREGKISAAWLGAVIPADFAQSAATAWLAGRLVVARQEGAGLREGIGDWGVLGEGACKEFDRELPCFAWLAFVVHPAVCSGDALD